MAWVVNKTGASGRLESLTLGNILSSKLRVVMEHVTWNTTGYLWSQAGSSTSTREFGLAIVSGEYKVYAGGLITTLATEALYPLVDVTVDFTVDYINNTAKLIFGGVTAFDGAISVGTGRVNNEKFRFFARGGGYYAPDGSQHGNTQIYIDDVLVRNYDFDGSDHSAGTVTVTDTLGNNAIGFGLPTNGSAWLEIASDTQGNESVVTFGIGKPVFNVNLSVTLPRPNSVVGLVINGPEFSILSDVTLPKPISLVNIEVGKPAFSIQLSVTEPLLIDVVDSVVSININKPIFDIQSSVTLPRPVSIIQLKVSMPVFGVSMRVSGLLLVTSTSGKMMIPADSNSLLITVSSNRVTIKANSNKLLIGV